MPRIHDIMAVHGVGEQSRGDTLSVFAKHFYKAVREAVQEVGQDPNTEIKLVGRFGENRMELHYGDDIFRLWEISWERSFKVPSAGKVLSWLWQWSSLYLYWAYAQRRGTGTTHRGRRPLPRTMLLLFVLLDLTLFFPLVVTVYWLWVVHNQVRHQKTDENPADQPILLRSHFATGLALALSVPFIIVVQLLARLFRIAAEVPLVGPLAARMAQNIENLVIGSAGDGMLYIFDSVQAAFIRGDLEKAIEQAHQIAVDEGREPLIHVIGHSLGSVISYEVVSYSLRPEIRQSVKTLCTMGTVLDMIRFILNSGGLVLAEQARFGQSIPLPEQGKSYPRWLNLFSRNDPAPGFGPLAGFGPNPTNRPVRSTPKGHSTYWSDVDGVHRVILAWIARPHPVFGNEPQVPSLNSQTSIVGDVARAAGKAVLFVTIFVSLIFIGASWFDVSPSGVADQLYEPLEDATLPWPLSWFATGFTWLLARLVTIVVNLPGWYLQWLIWLGGLVLVWVVVLGIPTLTRMAWRRAQRRRLVPVEKDASLDYWCAPLDGMGPDHVLALRKKGIWSLHDFLVAVVKPGGAARIARYLDVSQEQVTQWTRQANLMRVRGVGFAESVALLEAGIDSLTALSKRKIAAPAKLHPTLQAEDVDDWIEQAKTLRDVM